MNTNSKIKEIVDCVLLSSYNNQKDRTANSTIIQTALKCSSNEMNESMDILVKFGTFTDGYGDLKWNTFKLDANHFDFVQSGGIKAFEIRKRNNVIKTEIDRWLDRIFNLF